MGEGVQIGGKSTKGSGGAAGEIVNEDVVLEHYLRASSPSLRSPRSLTRTVFGLTANRRSDNKRSNKSNHNLENFSSPNIFQFDIPAQ
jgi:hypothetical protein